MRELVAAIVILASGLVVGIRPVSACSCATTLLCNDDFSSYEPTDTLVFVGRVAKVSSDFERKVKENLPSGLEPSEIRLQPQGTAPTGNHRLLLEATAKAYLDVWADLLDGAEVEAIRSISNPDQVLILSMAAKRVELEVEEQFVGEPPDRITVATGMGGGDCGIPFEVGRRYLVIANRGGRGVYYTGVCSQTAPVEAEPHALAALRAWKRGEEFPRTVFGRLVDSTTRADRHQPRPPLADVRLTLKGSSHTVKAITDAEGAFELQDVPADTYQVLVDLPGWKHSRVSDGLKPLDMATNRCASLSVWMEQEQGAIRGVLEPAPGEALPEYIWVEAIPADSQSEAPFDGTAKAETGGFEIDEIEPGSFYIAINVDNYPNGPSHSTASNGRVRPYPPTYFPGVSDPAKAAVFRVDRGQTVAIGEWVLPPKLKEVRLPARVVMPDGSPADDARLVLRRIGREKERISQFGPTGADGEVELIVLEKLAMEVEAVAAKDGRFYRAIVHVDPESSANPIVIELRNSERQESDRQFFETFLWSSKPRSR